MEQLRALRDVVSRVLIAGTPARLDAGTPAVKAAPSKRRNSPEFTCRARVRTHIRGRVCLLEESSLQRELPAAEPLAFSFSLLPFTRATRLCSRDVVRSGARRAALCSFVRLISALRVCTRDRREAWSVSKRRALFGEGARCLSRCRAFLIRMLKPRVISLRNSALAEWEQSWRFARSLAYSLRFFNTYARK